MDDVQKMSGTDLEHEVDGILHPEADEGSFFHCEFPHPRLATEHGLDTSYFKGPMDRHGDRTFERLIEDENDPLFDVLQSITVPRSLLTAALELFGQSLIAYHDTKTMHGWYRFYPPILMTVWAAFESWVRIESEILVKVAPGIPGPVRDALLEVKNTVKDNGKIMLKPDRRPVLDRYWILLKYGCNLEFDRGSRIWQNGEQVVRLRDSLVHYDVSKAPTITASETWRHMESAMLLFIAPSTMARRTLFDFQFDYFNTLTALRPLISEFEERPLHKGWSREPEIFSCPFDGVDDVKYPKPYPPKRDEKPEKAG